MAVHVRLWTGWTLYFTQRNNKKKTKVGRAESACPKDFGIMFCSFLTNHPSGLIPIPFGLSASRPVKLLSFSFFRFFCFFWKYIYVFRYGYMCVSESLFTYSHKGAFISIRKSIPMQKSKIVKTYVHKYSYTSAFTYRIKYICKSVRPYRIAFILK